MNGNVTFVGLNFQERVEEEHLKKEGNNGESYWGIRARLMVSKSFTNDYRRILISLFPIIRFIKESLKSWDIRISRS